MEHRDLSPLPPVPAGYFAFSFNRRARAAVLPRSPASPYHATPATRSASPREAMKRHAGRDEEDVESEDKGEDEDEAQVICRHTLSDTGNYRFR